MAPYFLRNLLPKKERVEHVRPLWEVLAGLTWTQWGLFFSGWLAWTCATIDFFCVDLNVYDLESQFDRWITRPVFLALLLRPIGAVIFGLISDRFGRKWPLVINLLLISLLTLVSGFAQTFQQFIALRYLFSIGVGGIWGLATATALENLPIEARGLASGVLQQGYTVGYIVATVINLYLVPRTTWRTLFRVAFSLSTFAAAFRASLPESEVFLRARREEEIELEEPVQSKTQIFFREVGQMFKRHWRRWIYAVSLMSGFGFLSYGSQDLYGAFLELNKRFSEDKVTNATMIGSCGAIAGGVIAGGLSQNAGRRLTIITCIFAAGVFIPLWLIPNTFSGLAAGAFCFQFSVQGAFGIVPIFLSEISPPAFRSTFTGVTYQLGYTVASVFDPIADAIGNRFPLAFPESKIQIEAPDFSILQGILVGSAVAYIIVFTLIGPENHGSHFERSKMAFQPGASRDEVNPIPEEIDGVEGVEMSSVWGEGSGEKGRSVH